MADLQAQQKGLERIQEMSSRVAVVVGSCWIFNPAEPVDPELAQRLERYRGDVSYEAAMAYISIAFIDAHEGLAKQFSPKDIPFRRAMAAEAVKAAIAEINQESVLQYTTDAGIAEQAVVDQQCHKVGVGNRRAYKTSTTTKHTQETRIYVIFPEEEPTAAAPPVAPAPTRGAVVQQTPAEKIMELKGLLDAGAINQHEFDLKKAELLAKI